MLPKSGGWDSVEPMKTLAVYQELGLVAAAGADAPAEKLPPADPARHAYHRHAHLWDYCDPRLARPFAGPESPVVFASPGDGLTLDEAHSRTRLIVMLGAHDTPELRAAMNRPGAACLVFEPSVARLEAFCGRFKPRDLAGKGVFLVGGDVDGLDVPLLSMLPESLCELGYPLFFAAEGLPEAMPGYVARVEELVELFHYRNVIYNLEGQDNIRGMPIRPMRRDAVYDRYKHLYENLEPCLKGGVLQDLLGALTGHAAILCAAGPALGASLDFIRENRDRAVVIAVNSALKPLLAAGIRPHFAVINDTSVGSEPTLAGLGPLPDVTLVAHCLSTTGSGSFEGVRFFGNFPGQPFPKRDSLMLHGSVITTAFSLAEYLGCVKAVLAGVQLSSPDPYRLNYAAGSQHEHHASGLDDSALEHRWPELYPVTAADGSRAFTTLNFLDAARWFADRIRQASLEVINLCPQSILTGPGIAFDPAPELSPAPGLATALAGLKRSDFTDRQERVLDFIRQEMARWKHKQVTARGAPADFQSAVAYVAQSDLDNTSFMLQRFADFDNARFHAGFFQAGSLGERLEAAKYHASYMERMCSELLAILLDQHRRIRT